MKRMSFLILAIILVVSCKKEIKDANPETAQGLSHQINTAKEIVTYPFKVSFYTTEDPDPSIPPTACSGDIPGFANPGYFLHGHASLLGLIDPAQSRGQDVSCNLSLSTFILTTTVAGQIAAANGDLLYYTGNDVLNLTNLFTNAGPTGSISGVWTITGGTGRFVGATGSFTINGPVDFATRTFSFTGEGTITY